MLSSQRIQTAFRSEILRESADMIRIEQLKVVNDWNLIDSGDLALALQKRHFTVRDFNTGGRLTVRVLKYMRFLDINGIAKGSMRRGAYHLYNRILFGYLYNQTMPQLKYGYTEEVQQLMRNKLIEMGYK